MKKQMIIEADIKQYRLRNINEGDLEELRIWKNLNKSSFFYQKEISADEQKKWFEGYINRENDYIYIIEECVDDIYKHKIGCIGFRVQEGNVIDIYNVIRGNKSMADTTMLQAMHLLIAYIEKKFTRYEIKCDVLNDNIAKKWYEKCGFVVKECYEQYSVMKWNKEKE